MATRPADGVDRAWRQRVGRRGQEPDGAHAETERDERHGRVSTGIGQMRMTAVGPFPRVELQHSSGARQRGVQL